MKFIVVIMKIMKRVKKKFKIYRISCEENIIVKSILFIINFFSSQFIEKKYEVQKQILKKNGFLDNL